MACASWVRRIAEENNRYVPIAQEKGGSLKPQPSAAEQYKKELARAKRQKWENLFIKSWNGMGGDLLVLEYPFHPHRKWRFDFAHLPTMIAIEVEGGTWSKSRHTSGRGYKADCEKYNTAIFRGWRVFRLTPEMITEKNVCDIIEFMRQERSKAV